MVKQKKETSLVPPALPKTYWNRGMNSTTNPRFWVDVNGTIFYIKEVPGADFVLVRMEVQ